MRRVRSSPIRDPVRTVGIGFRASQGAEREGKSPRSGFRPFAVRGEKKKSNVYARSTRGLGFPVADSFLEDESPRMDHPSDTSDMSSRNAVNASAFETFDSVDEAYAAEVYGLKESSTTETDPEAVRRARRTRA